jgi:hypothetical protein
MSQGVTFPDDKTMAGITNNFNKRISDFSLGERYNILFDTTGQNFRAISNLLYQSRQRGYKTYFVVIYASLETCQRRVQMRNEKLIAEGSGRIQLPLEIAGQIYSGFMQQKGTASMFLVDYSVSADQIILYNNNIDGAEPELLYRRIGEKVDFVTNFSGFYNMNIISLPPYIIKLNSGGKRKKSYRRRRTKRNKTIRNKRKSRKL